MKTLQGLLMSLFILLTGSFCFAQQPKKIQGNNPLTEAVDTRVDNMGYWMEKAEKGLVPYNPHTPYLPEYYRGTGIRVHGVRTTNSPDVPVTNLTNVTESENSVFVDPNNASYLLNSNNSTSWSGSSVGSLYGANYFQSSSNGVTWFGSEQGAGGSNSGDPTTAIGLSGRQFVNFIDDPGGQGIAWSDNGTTWSTATIAPNPGDLADKNHMWIDNKSTSPYEGNLYTAWTAFGGSDDAQIVISRSVNDGVTWSTPANISSAILAGSHNQGVNVKTGPNGEVYAAWAVYDGWPTDETAIGFVKSTNGGVSYPAATRIISNIKGIRTTGVLKNMRVNSFPVMAVDVSGGAFNGNIYIVWTNVGVPGTNTGTNKSVYIIRSSDGGTTWSTPVRVNQGTFADGKEAYCPWISCDPETGVLTAIFYDDRNTGSAQCEVYSAYSVDAGTTWTDFLVSDVAFTPAAIPGLAGGYMGDYLGITSKGGRVYPCWTDNRGGVYMTYVSPFELGLNAAFVANVTTLCTGTAVTYSDVSTGPPTSWTWSFPGGMPSTFSGQTPPPVTYAAPGVYNVSLTVSDGTNTDTETRLQYITVKDVIAKFTGTPTTVVIGNTVTFTDNSQCNPTSWNWVFPGGTPSSFSGQYPPAITYPTIGTYDVSLAVTKAGSTDTLLKTGYITVTPPIFNITNGSITTCTGDFYDSGGPTGNYQNNENYTETFYPSTAGSMIQFTFTSFSTESGYDYLRIYNGTSTAAPLIGTYNGTTGPGTVTANNAAGALTFNFTSDVSVTPAGWTATINCQSTTLPPVADFTASSVAPPIYSTVTFTDQTANLPVSWTWSFSPSSVTYVGGTTANSQNPQVQFNTLGAYTVSLTAANANGTSTKTKTGYINTIACSPCSSTSSNATEEWISNVTFNTINNTSAGGLGYQDFTSLSTTVIPGSTYPISASCGSTGSWSEYIWAFVDWNQDCDFTDTGEAFNIGQVTGPGSVSMNITAPSDALSGTTRMRVTLKYNGDPTSCETFSYGQVEDYTVIVQGSTHLLNLQVFLEGYFNTISNGMNQAQECLDGLNTFNKFSGTTVDTMSVLLANPADPWAIVYQAHGVNIHSDGSLSLTIPSTYSASYYIVIKPRNGVETWSATPVSFSGGIITYNFTTLAGQAFGNNQKKLVQESNIFGLFSGDVTSAAGGQDGYIDIFDNNDVFNLGQNGVFGYTREDVTGDGFVDIFDLVMIFNNMQNGTGMITPPNPAKK
jgi:PKD repeat protein